MEVEPLFIFPMNDSEIIFLKDEASKYLGLNFDLRGHHLNGPLLGPHATSVRVQIYINVKITPEVRIHFSVFK